MTLSEKLNEYSKTIGFSFKELSEVSGVSTGTISNYRAGKQIPKMNNPKLSLLAKAIAEIGISKGMVFDYDDVLRELQKSVGGKIEVSPDNYILNMNMLLKTLNISNASLARNLNYDPSQISRFLSGERLPADIGKFSTQVASFIANNYSDAYSRQLQKLFSCEQDEIDSPAKIRKKIIKWLGSNVNTPVENPIDSFLENLDEFDLNDFISAIHFNDIKVPSVPFEIPITNYYRGIDEFKKAEFDFIKSAVLSKSKDDVIIYSDMPIAEMAKDEEFAKKYMAGLAVMLKKGLHINFIHDVHRPFEEMMIGLEGHIPMYMTGQISPYYFSEPQSKIFSHLLKVSGTSAMCGFAVTSDHEDGLYIVTKNKSEVQKYQNSARDMLKRAKPLMEIYRSDRSDEFLEQLYNYWKNGSKKMIFSGLPIFTISDELLTSILRRSGKPQEIIDNIVSFKNKYYEEMKNLLIDNCIVIEISKLSRESFNEHPVNIGLSELFIEEEIPYNYDEYVEHMKQTCKFAEDNDNCTLKTEKNRIFKNISFSIISGKCVIVSKAKAPTIHFIIHHPKMIKAFEMFIPPLRNND